MNKRTLCIKIRLRNAGYIVCYLVTRSQVTSLTVISHVTFPLEMRHPHGVRV